MPEIKGYLRLCAAWLAAALFATNAFATNAFAENAAQCNQKLYHTLYNRAATAAELGAQDPLAQVDAMLVSAEFREVFARYVNAHMNWGPADNQDENPVYLMVRNYILARDRPWHELFTAKIDVVGQNINPKPDAVGYFENRFWKKRYAGNEEEGFKLRTAYLILNNVIGLKLDALTVTSNGGSSRADRANPDNVCVSCHFNLPFALDKVATILDRVDRQASDAQNTLYKPPLGPFPQTIYGEPVANLDQLVNMLVTREEFFTNSCHLAFQFVFGRSETAFESELFGQCIEQFKTSGKMTGAIKGFVVSDLFCQ